MHRSSDQLASSAPESIARPAGRFENDWIVPLAVFLVGALLIASRRPDAILNPQFFIEDGVLWFAEAHERGGLRVLASTSYRGYLHTLPRLGALAAQTVPLLWAPLVMNLLAILSGALPAALVASRRFATVLPSSWARLLAAFLYLAMPSAWTTMANMTHTQWHFALLSVLVVVASAPATRGWKLFDVAGSILSGLTGPSALLLAPVAALAWWMRRTRWSLALATIAATLALLQIVCILLTQSPTEGSTFLGASVSAFFELVVVRVVYGAFLGNAGIARYAGGALSSPVLLALAGAGAALAVAYALWRGSAELRLVLLFAALVYLASIAWPPGRLYTDVGYWEALMAPPNGNRYFLIPIFALVLVFVWLASRAEWQPRVCGALAILVMLAFGVRLDWREPPLEDYDFARYVQKYERAAAGERVQIVTPPGWSFIITKR
jgi:hypothetical protein